MTGLYNHASERTYPCLACADLDATISFYETLGFAPPSAEVTALAPCSTPPSSRSAQ